MGFKDNLRNELQFRGLTVKELSALSGIKKQTLDNYLSTHNSTPSAEAAVKIAQALNVSVEYLVTGKNSYSQKEPDLQLKKLEFIFNNLTSENRKLLLDISEVINKDSVKN